MASLSDRTEPDFVPGQLHASQKDSQHSIGSQKPAIGIISHRTKPGGLGRSLCSTVAATEPQWDTRDMPYPSLARADTQQACRTVVPSVLPRVASLASGYILEGGYDILPNQWMPLSSPSTLQLSFGPLVLQRDTAAACHHRAAHKQLAL